MTIKEVKRSIAKKNWEEEAKVGKHLSLSYKGVQTPV